MPKSSASINVLDHMQQQWNACYQEQQVLLQEVKALRAEVAEADHKREIAVQNAYEAGYTAGQEDTLRQGRSKT